MDEVKCPTCGENEPRTDRDGVGVLSEYNPIALILPSLFSELKEKALQRHRL